MPKRKYDCLESLSRKERSDLDTTLHPNVDSFLKSFKTSYRRAQLSLASLQNEGKILERVYYKSKNQHRAALFWKRLCELRRFSSRLFALNPLGSLSAFSRCFFGGNSQKKVPPFKEAWSHFPDEGSLHRAVDEFKMLQLFFERLSVRSMEAFRHFGLAMQSGAFMQLLLSSIAVASRFGCLAQELSSVLSDLLPQVRSLKTVVSTPRGSAPLLDLTSTTGKDIVVMTDDDSKLSTGQESLRGDEEMLPLPQEEAILPMDTFSLYSQQRVMATSLQPQAPSPPRPKAANPNPKKVKKKAKRDEIDDIFGF